jgi:hypothetical protein
MELTDIAKSRRNEFNIHGLENLVADELFVSVWLYLPASWGLHTTNNWYSLGDQFFTDAPDYVPYSALLLYETDITKNTFSLDFQTVTGSNKVTLGTISNYPLPRGRWFNVQYYVYRHVTSGILKVWIDGALLFDIHNVSTKSPSISQWFTTPAKIYYDTSDTFSPYRLWVDDLEIYSEHSTSSSTATPLAPPIPGFTWESILVGVIMGLGALAVTRGRKNLPS